MKGMIKDSFALELSRFAKWNYTTVIRPHYKISDSFVKKVESLISLKGIKALFYIFESDPHPYDGYSFLNNRHVHIMMQWDSRYGIISRDKLYKTMRVSERAVRDIQPIKNKESLSYYLIKSIRQQKTIYNLMTND